MTQTNTPFASTISGRGVVFFIFWFAAVFVTFMYVYWHFHTAPFRPLQEAIRREFPDSAPLVQGGQRKIHKHTPRILRITVRVPFDPIGEQEERVQSMFARLVELAAQFQPLKSYDELEVHFVHFRSEEQAQKRTISQAISELRVGRPGESL